MKRISIWSFVLVVQYVIISLLSIMFGCLSTNVLFYNEEIYIKNYLNSFFEKGQWIVSSDANLNFIQSFFDEYYMNTLDYQEEKFIQKYDLNTDDEGRIIKKETDLYEYVENILLSSTAAIKEKYRTLNTSKNIFKKVFYKEFLKDNIEFSKQDSVLRSSFFESKSENNYYDYKFFVVDSFFELLLELFNKQMQEGLRFVSVNVTPSLMVTLQNRKMLLSNYKFETFTAKNNITNSIIFYILIIIVSPAIILLAVCLYFCIYIFQKYKKSSRHYWVICFKNRLLYKKISRKRLFKLVGWHSK